MKKVAVLYSEYTPVIDAIKCQLKDAEVNTYNSIPTNHQDFDLIISTNFKTESDISMLKTHYSLLPAFEDDEPVKSAILFGAKVTGLTIFFNNPFKIITQYPLIISNSSHYDNVEQELRYLEQIILPLVAEKILNNEPFEIQSLLKNKNCNGNCGSCGGCNH